MSDSPRPNDQAGPAARTAGSRSKAATSAARGPSPLGPVVVLAAHQIRLLSRDRAAMFFTVVFPLLFGLGFGFIFQSVFGGGSGTSKAEIAVAMVDLDQSPASRAFAGALARGGTLTLQPQADQAEAENDVRLGRLAAAVIVPAGFGEGARRIFAAGEGLSVEVVQDPSRYAESATVLGLVQAASYQTFAAVLTDPTLGREALAAAVDSVRADTTMPFVERNLLITAMQSARGFLERRQTPAPSPPPGGEAEPGATPDTPPPPPAAASPPDSPEDTLALPAFQPITVRVRDVAPQRPEAGDARPTLRSAFDLTFGQGACWALLSCVTGFGLALVRERDGGTLLRLAAAPIARWQVIAGVALACFATAMAVLAMCRGVFWLVGVHNTRWAALALVFACCAWGFTGLMMLLAALAKTSGGAEGGIRAVLLVLALLGGAGVPQMFFQGWLAALPLISPFGWAIRAIDGVIWRGFSAAELALPCGVLLAVGTAGMALGAAAFRRWRV